MDALDLSDDPDLIGPPSDELPSRVEFLRTIGVPDGKASGLLRVLLARCKPDAALPDQLISIEHLGRFVVAGPAIATPARHQALARLELLVLALERVPAAKRRFQATLLAVLSGTRALKLFAEIGLPNDRGLLAEATDRLARKFLPEPPAMQLWMLAGRIIRSLDDLAWLGVEADGLLQRLATIGGAAWEPLRTGILDSIGLITTRIAALGLGEAFRARATTESLRASPLYRLTRVDVGEMTPLIAAARKHLETVRLDLEDNGVSLSVVYSLDSIEQSLSRLELLVPFVVPAEQTDYDIRAIVAAVGRGLVGGRSFTQLVSDNFRLLARKVIERAGRTGEHYVTSSRREYWKMLASAAGGGVVTLGTAAAKFLVKWGHFALFLEGLLSSLIYAGSFVAIQLLGFTLATKQPSMTAASLAGTIRDRTGPDQLDALVPLIARIARSQFAAVVGNLSAVIVTAVIFDFVYRHAIGHSYLDAETARTVIESFDPFTTGTVLFGALTGVVLWISSLFAGWFENWVVYRRLPEAIEHHRFAKRLGKARMARFARFLEREAAGFGGSISLGFLLGMVPVFAQFFGLPIKLHHITLSTGSFTLAVSSVGILSWGAFTAAVFGIALVGLLQFGVSFTLALVVALRARDVPRGERRTLPRAVFRRFLQKPLEFFYPPHEPTVPAADLHRR